MTILNRLVKSLWIKCTAFSCAVLAGITSRQSLAAAITLALVGGKVSTSAAPAAAGMPEPAMVMMIGTVALEIASAAMLAIGNQQKHGNDQLKQIQQEISNLDPKDPDYQKKKAELSKKLAAAAKQDGQDCNQGAQDNSNKLAGAAAAAGALAAALSATACLKYHLAKPMCIAAVGVALAETVASLMAMKGNSDNAAQQCQQLAEDAAALEDPLQSVADNATPKIDTPAPTDSPTPGPTDGLVINTVAGSKKGGACSGGDCTDSGGLGSDPTGLFGKDGTFGGGNGGRGLAGGSSSHGDGLTPKTTGAATKNGEGIDGSVAYTDDKSGGAGANAGAGGAGADGADPTHQMNLDAVKIKNGLEVTDASGKSLTLWQRATYRYYGPVGSRYMALAKVEKIRKDAGVIAQATIKIPGSANRAPASVDTRASAAVLLQKK